MPLINNFITALQFLTVINVRNSLSSEKSLAESTRYFPLIGIIIGCFLAVVYLISSEFLPATVVSALVIISLVWITRGLHLDGFVDSVDGLLGGADKDERLRIMKDTQVGSLGVVAVVCLILLKFTLILEILSVSGGIVPVILILILAPALSRWSMVCAMYFFPYARAQGTGHFTKFAGAREVLAASIITLIFSAGLLKSEGLLIMLCVFIFTLAVSKYVSLKIGGMTGDTYGALNEVVEVFVLLIYLLLFIVY